MATPTPPSRPPTNFGEVAFAALTRSAGMGVLACVVSLVAVLAVQSWPAFANAGPTEMFTSSDWRPEPPRHVPHRERFEAVAAVGGVPLAAAEVSDGQVRPADEPDVIPRENRQLFGALAFVFGTLATSAIAMCVAVPLGVAAAAFLAEIAPPPVRKVGMFLIELLAAIPSVVYGFWGLTVLAPTLQEVFNLFGGPNTGGNGILAAGLVLAVMILPYITAISFDVIRAVPRASREGSLALGASRWQTIWGVVLPTARPGIVAASFLALGRALGETMAVTMLIGNKSVINYSPFAYGDSIASKMANSVAEAGDPKARSALFALALILFVVTAVTNLLARFILARLSRSRTSGVMPAEPEAVAGEVVLPTPPPESPPVRSRAAFWNVAMTWVLGAATLATVVPLFLIFGLIVVKGVSAVSDPTLFKERGRANLTNEQFEQYQAYRRGEADDYPRNELGRYVDRGGLGPHMLGSAVMVLGASLVAVPLGLLTAVWLAEARRSRLAAVVRGTVELLGGVPSIVIGLFVYTVLCAPSYEFVRGADAAPLKASAWAGMAALAILMVPVVVRSAEEAMRLVPDALREASYALGANRMQTTLRVIIPASLPAIVTGIFLAMGRIAGETAPLIFTSGQNDDWPLSFGSLFGSYPFLTGKINEFAQSAYHDFKDQAWGGTLVLMAAVMILNIGIRLAAGKRVVAASSG